MEPASEPEEGSVRQKAAYSPPVTRGRYLLFCSGLPNRRIPLNPMDWCAPSVMPTPRSCAPTTCTHEAVSEGTQRSHTYVLHATGSHLDEPRVLRVVEAEPAQLGGHLQAESAEIP